MATVTISDVGLQSGTDRTVYVTWTWSKSNTDHYRVIWKYATGDGVWFIGEDTTVTVKQSVHTASSNATQVKVKVKPISKTYTKNDTETHYWTADWTSYEKYKFKNNPPETPSVPTVTLDKYTMTVEVDYYGENKATSIQFQVMQDDSTKFADSGEYKCPITLNHAAYSFTVAAGHKYKARCRACYPKNEEYSDWTEYSDNVETIPSALSDTPTCKALTTTSAELTWTAVSNATSYEVEYASKKSYFDSSSETQTLTVTSARAEVTGLDSGEEWFFRVRAINDQGESGWSEIVSTVLGKVPAAPTTWSSTTTAMVGNSVTLYWVHNSQDGSSQTYAEIELTINGTATTVTVQNSTDEDEKDKTSSYVLDTSSYTEESTIKWRVRTMGITGEYGEWSTQRTIEVYAAPSIAAGLQAYDGTWIETITSLPFYVSATAYPDSQNAVCFYIVIQAYEAYETVDNVGNSKWVNAGEEVYTKYINGNGSSNWLAQLISAGDINLENNIVYMATVSVSMDSGLSAESSFYFTVSWSESLYEPDAEIGIDEDSLSAYIRPYCVDDDENLVSGVLLSVYRREFDGTFTELITGLSNTSYTTVTDPHPSLDYARYRIVAISESTGAVSYYDPPGYPVGEGAVVMQWDEAWSNFENQDEDELEEPTWSGSLLKLPYNIDVADSYSPDVALVEYIGRSHPVSYYGTQVGSTATWNVEIDREDTETLYALRRLAIWTGDVYVREPSGSGYWANVAVSFSRKHEELVIPVTFTITRVEGGV